MPKKKKMQDLRSLFVSTWELFAAAWWKLVLIYLLASILTMFVCLAFLAVAFLSGVGLAAAAYASSALGPAVYLAWGQLLLAALLVITVWVAAGISMTLITAKPDTTLDKAVSVGFTGMFWSYLLVAALTGLAVWSGFLLFFVPGVLLLVWLVFAKISVVLDGKKGLDAMLASMHLVRGSWWPVFGRLLLGAVLLWAGSLVATSLSLGLGPGINYLWAAISTPLALAYVVAMYQDLSKVKGSMPKSFGKKRGGLMAWLIIAGVIAAFALGGLVVLVGLGLTFLATAAGI